MHRGKSCLGGLIIVIGLVILAFSVPGWAWGAVIGIIFVTVGVVCIKR